MGNNRDNKRKPERTGKLVKVGKPEDVPAGRGATVKLKDGKEVALFNLGGEFHAIENFCPHKGYPLADSLLSGNIGRMRIFTAGNSTCATGKCFEKKDCSVESYEVKIEDGWIKILI